VDAAFLEHGQRARLRREAERHGVACVIVQCAASEATLRARVNSREAQGEDASDAGLAVLERQLAAAQPLAPEEQAIAILLDTETAEGRERGLDAVAARLAAAAASGAMTAQAHAAH
jgi:hypothetical protein